METVRDFILGGSQITADGDYSHEIKTCAPWKKSCDHPRQHIKNPRHYFANRGPSNQSYGFSSGVVWVWDSDHKDSWVLQNWCFWTMVLEKTPENLVDCKDIKPVNPKEISPEYSLKELMLKLKLQYLGHLMQSTASLEKDPDGGKYWWQKKGMTEDEMFGWHHQNQ